MIDLEPLERANKVLERLFKLDDAIANARAFRALLENLHGRDLSVVKEPHIAAIFMVRAGILRSAIGTVMACLDPEDRRGNRGSVGQILDMLKDTKLVASFFESRTVPDSNSAALRQVNGDYRALIESDQFKREKRFRNDAIAHILIPNDPNDRTPEVTYDDLYFLHDIAEGLVTGLYRVCDRGAPSFPGHQTRLTEHAGVFWDTYFRGMESSQVRP